MSLCTCGQHPQGAHTGVGMAAVLPVAGASFPRQLCPMSELPSETLCAAQESSDLGVSPFPQQACVSGAVCGGRRPPSLPQLLRPCHSPPQASSRGLHLAPSCDSTVLPQPISQVPPLPGSIAFRPGTPPDRCI